MSEIKGVGRGVDGWYEAVEVDALTAERVRVRQVVRWAWGRFRIVGVSRSIKPETPDGVVVRLEVLR